MMKFLSLKDLLLNTISVSFIGQYIQLVPGVFKALCVSSMETVGVFDLLAGHERICLKIRILAWCHCLIIHKSLGFFCAFLFCQKWGFPYLKIGNFYNPMGSIEKRSQEEKFAYQVEDGSFIFEYSSRYK